MSATHSNGTDGAIWEARWCDRCTADEGYRDGSDPAGCEIHLNALVGLPVDEWTRDDTGSIVCSVFQAVTG